MGFVGNVLNHSAKLQTYEKISYILTTFFFLLNL